MFRRAKGMQRRFNRKGQKKARLLRPLAAKKYTYDFNLLPQILTIDQTTGNAVLSTEPTAGSFPLVQSNITQYSSATGLNNIIDVAASAGIRVNDIINSTAFLTMYDAYKINSVKLTIEFLNNNSLVNSSGCLPTLYIYNDQDDITVPPTLQSLTGKSGYKMFSFGNRGRTKYAYKWRPTVSQALNTLPTGTFPTGIGKSQWINCGGQGPNVEHYGLKLWLADVYNAHPGPAQTVFRLSWTYNVSFRSPLLAA